MLSRIFLFSLFLLACCALWKWLASYPHPDVILGIDFVVFAMLGVVVSLRGPVPLWEKLVYASACVFLAVVGVKLTIQQSNETAKASQNLSDTLVKVTTSTQEIERLEGLNTQLQQKLILQSSTISKLAQDSFANIMGTDSFPYIVPQPSPYPQPIPLFIWDHGKHLLSGVTVTIRRSTDFNYHTPIDVGVLHPGWGKPLSAALLPQPDPKTGEDIFLIDMYTQSDYFSEVLHFRRSHDGKYWASRFWVTAFKFGSRPDTGVVHVKVPKPIKGGSVSYLIFDASQWTDEPKKEN